MMERIPTLWDFTQLNFDLANRFIFFRNLHENMNVNGSLDLPCASVLYANTWHRAAN